MALAGEKAAARVRPTKGWGQDLVKYMGDGKRAMARVKTVTRGQQQGLRQ